EGVIALVAPRLRGSGLESTPGDVHGQLSPGEGPAVVKLRYDSSCSFRRVTGVQGPCHRRIGGADLTFTRPTARTGSSCACSWLQGHRPAAPPSRCGSARRSSCSPGTAQRVWWPSYRFVVERSR